MARQYNATEIADALRETKGMVYIAAERLGCTAGTVYNYMAKYPSVKAAADAANGQMGDIAELRLYDAIQRKEAWAIAFYLKTKGKQRGYTERVENVNLNVPTELVQKFMDTLAKAGLQPSDVFESMIAELATVEAKDGE